MNSWMEKITKPYLNIGTSACCTIPNAVQTLITSAPERRLECIPELKPYYHYDFYIDPCYADLRPVQPDPIAMELEREMRRKAWEKHWEENEERLIEKVISDMYKPKKIIRNGPATIVIWKDMSKTVIKLKDGDKADDFAAFCIAFAKKNYGSVSAIRKAMKKADQVMQW